MSNKKTIDLSETNTFILEIEELETIIEIDEYKIHIGDPLRVAQIVNALTNSQVNLVKRIMSLSVLAMKSAEPDLLEKYNTLLKEHKTLKENYKKLEELV